jgi:hypothetical protein
MVLVKSQSIVLGVLIVIDKLTKGLEIIRLRHQDIIVGATDGMVYVYTPLNSKNPLKADSFSPATYSFLDSYGWYWNERFASWAFLLD